MRHRGDAGPVHLAEIHDKAGGIIGQTHPPRNGLAEGKVDADRLALIADGGGCGIQPGQGREILGIGKDRPEQEAQKEHQK